ncbi:MAG TPA: hypothetical protein PLU30_06855 [Verrucomicrobiae bacterium]|nr:hypothetical protein [Verrucomicrobiae bacterium]
MDLIRQGLCAVPCGLLMSFSEIDRIPSWVLYACGSAAILVFCSFIVIAIKTWEQIRPTQEQIRERQLRAQLKVKGSSLKHLPHRVIIQNSVAPAFRQAGLGHYMPLMETHPSRYPGGEESEMIDLTKFIMHVLRDGHLAVRETHSGSVIISSRDLSTVPTSVVLERMPGASWAWRAHAEAISPEDMQAHAEVAAVGDNYANEWLFSLAPSAALILGIVCPGAPLPSPGGLPCVALVLGAVGWLCALVYGPVGRRLWRRGF